jgi:hypothetical protein
MVAIFDDADEPDGFFVELVAASFNAREIENLIDQPE